MKTVGGEKTPGRCWGEAAWSGSERSVSDSLPDFVFLSLSVLICEMGYPHVSAGRTRREHALQGWIQHPPPLDPGSRPGPPMPSQGASPRRVPLLQCGSWGGWQLGPRQAGNCRTQHGSGDPSPTWGPAGASSELCSAPEISRGTWLSQGPSQSEGLGAQRGSESPGAQGKGKWARHFTPLPDTRMVCPGHPDWFLASVRTPRRPRCQATA